MAQWNLLKLRKYKGLVSEDDSLHSIHTVSQISDISKLSGHFSQTGNANQTLLSCQHRQPNLSNPQYPNNQYQSSYQCTAPYFGTCYLCRIFGHLGKNCPNRTKNLQNAQSYLQGLPSQTGPLLLSLITPPNISSHIFTPNKPPVLMQQLTVDYVLNQNAWDEIITKLKEMAKENRLNKQAVHKTYNTAAGMLGKAKRKTLVTNPDDRINSKKQTNPGSKGDKFYLRYYDCKSMMTPSQKIKSTKPILKTNIKTMTDDQQSVTMINEETESWNDTKTDHAYDHSSDQEVNMDFLFPDLSSESY